ncbi:MAG TPA: P-loop NTPase [Candidatus Dormibacteraeota bacterium]|nr:P-loop NTPase [Candidatus Dormibacteraeota bacterium]
MSSTFEITPQTKINALVEAMPIAADVLSRFGLHCAGCGVNKYETIEQGVSAHGLRIEPVLTALSQARLTGRVPQITHEDTTPLRRAPGEFSRRAQIKHLVPIMSGKGGVGKSLTTSLLAVALRRKNYRVGILDADITGPSIPRFFGLTTPLGLEEDPNAPPPAPGQAPQALMVPAMTTTAIQVVSSNLLTAKEDTAMVWRGPIVAGVIRQFYEQALWNDLDYLLVDLPPGTSDAPLTVLQSLRVDGVVLVTMPQRLATMIVRKAANLIHQLKKPILGVIENMSYFEAPDTHRRYEIFGPSYADQVAELAGAPVLARLPIDPTIVDYADHGRIEEVEGPLYDAMAEHLLQAVEHLPTSKETISLI